MARTKHKSSRSSRLYVVVDHDGQRFVIRSTTVPTEASHGRKYRYAIGPFRTRKAAEIMRDFGFNNPHLLCVVDAERAAASGHKFEGVC